jgi:hypothetical protein
MLDFFNHLEKMKAGTTCVWQIFSGWDGSQYGSHGLGWGLRLEEERNHKRVWRTMAAVILFGSQMLVGIVLIKDGQASILGYFAVPSLLEGAMITCIAVTG